MDSRQWHAGVEGWRFLSFRNLGKVQTLRFLGLCAHYEQRDGLRLRERMIPPDDWDTDDKAEMQALLDKAAQN